MRITQRAVLILALYVVLSSVMAAAQVPPFVSYQGRLKDGAGTPYDGTKLVKFAVYDGAGIPLWNSGFVLTTFNAGLFTTTLGGSGQPALPGSIFAADTGLTIGITVDTDPEIAPRTRFVAVPYAFAALYADTSEVAPGYLPLAGGTITGPITSAGDPPITMGKGNFGTNGQNPGTAAFVAGSSNTASGNFSVVSGGADNQATGYGSTVSGGMQNVASGDYAVIAGGGSAGLIGIRNHAVGPWSVIGGGALNKSLEWFSTVCGGYTNEVSGQYATVGGGAHNYARGDYSVVAGGGWSEADSNSATGRHSCISGGAGHRAVGWYSMIPGGFNNTTLGNSAFAAGVRARADHNGCFVWGDDTNADVTSSGLNQFIARASGGVKFFSNAALTAGVQLAAGGGSWSSISDRDLKEHFELVDPKAVVDAVASIPIGTWNYTSQDATIRHMGPMAQDFYAAFRIGEDDRHITTIDADGVALAAIQGLKQMVQEKEDEIEDLRKETRELRGLVETLLVRNAHAPDGGDARAAVDRAPGLQAPPR
jgi:hypothetical protein